jgi:LPS sulfotransferase NodH
VRQAVSQSKAKLTGMWHDYGKQPRKQEQKPIYQYDYIDAIARSLILQDASWQDYFTKANIRPLILVYEDFLQHPEGEIHRIFEYLDAIPLNEISSWYPLCTHCGAEEPPDDFQFFL